MNEDNKNMDQVDNPEEGQKEDEKTVTVAEMKRRLNNQKSDFESRLKELQKSFDDYKAGESERNNKAVEDYKNKKNMTAEELAEFQMSESEKTHKAEKDALQAKIDELEQEKLIAKIKDIAINKLSELKIQAKDETLKLVLTNNPEETTERIELLNKLLLEERQRIIGEEPPTSSGGIAGNINNKTLASIFDEARITK